MNVLDAIAELKALRERSREFKLDIYDRAKIDTIIVWLKELDRVFFEMQKLFEA